MPLTQLKGSDALFWPPLVARPPLCPASSKTFEELVLFSPRLFGHYQLLCRCCQVKNTTYNLSKNGIKKPNCNKGSGGVVYTFNPAQYSGGWGRWLSKVDAKERGKERKGGREGEKERQFQR